jgi:hypothetical protein
MPRPASAALIEPCVCGVHQTRSGRRPFALEIMLCVPGLQLWWSLGDLAMEKELHGRRSRQDGFCDVTGSEASVCMSRGAAIEDRPTVPH